METSDLGRVLRNARLNAGLAWALVGVVVLVAVRNALDGDPLWAGFAAVVALVSVVPAALLRSTRAMLPWEVVLLAALPLLARPFGPPGVSDVATYIAVAAIALIVAVELHVFTPVEMSYGFAVFFVVVATMAAAGIWAVVRWVADIYLGTGFLLDQRGLMLEFVASTAAGAVAGVVFEFYFRRYANVSERLEVDL
ncbi:hypothetical protein ACFQPA_03045 [Halomarina halobia]|uniref:Uncharacterized protein n=1 Tax=Halomarina halobia TaxID=3033386 RepID=A0ABD6A593_9EURY|nr:hypothetical protein [Halomarina sp. PSR21]